MKYLINHKKKVLITIILIIGFFAVFQSGLAQRIPLPPLLIEKIRSFLLNPDNKLKASDYKDGTIILIKPIATGVGEGRYEAGDIVEIRDGQELYDRFGDSDFLGYEERSKLIPLYLPQKLTEEQKQDLLASEYNTNKSPQPLASPKLSEGGPITKGGSNQSEEKPLLIKGDEGGFNTPSPSQEEGRGEVSKITKRRQYGIDYTLILSDKDILTIRQEKALNRIPEVKLENIINKNNRISYAQEKNPNFEFRISNKFSNDLISKFNNSKLIQNSKFKISARGGSAFGGKNCEGVICLPTRLAFVEKTTKQIKHLPDLIIPRAIAQSGPTELVKTVDTGGYADYMSLSAWESATQQDLTSTNYIAVAKCQHKTATSTADAAVIVTGWTTDATRYIKIWTDPNEPYRHNGKWSDSKYRIETTALYALDIYHDYTVIDGLQIKDSYNTAANNARDVLIRNPNITVSNNILLGNIGTTPLGFQAIQNSAAGAKIFNNIIYCLNGLGTGISDSSGAYVYNNTIAFCQLGIYSNYNTAVVKNNLAYKNATNYSATSWNAGCTNNLSGPDATTTPGTNPHNGYSVQFANEAAYDFHLSPLDTSARATGTNLSADSNMPFTTDIDGQSRPSSGVWDIGADHFAATAIYRSMGFNNTNPFSITDGSATLTISGPTAIFSSDQPLKIGVGDVIVYANNQGGTTATNSVAFIHGRTDAKTYTVKDYEGHLASSTYAATTKWAIYRAYISTANAEAGTENTGIPDTYEHFDLNWSALGGKNLASSTEDWNVACYADDVQTSATTIAGWTTTPYNYLRFYTPYKPTEVGTTQRHSGKWDNSKFRIEVTNTSYVFGTDCKYVQVDGMQIKHIGTAGVNYPETIQNTLTDPDSNLKISNNIINVNFTNLVSPGRGNVFANAAFTDSATTTIWNNIVFGQGISSFNEFSYGTIYSYNNTYNGIGTYSAYSGFSANGGTPVFITKNNIVQSVIFGPYSSGSDYNITNAGTLPGNNSKNKTIVKFVDPENYDFHLIHSDVYAKDKGVDLSTDPYLSFSTDIDGNARPSGKAWDIGADEATAGTVSGANPYAKISDPSLVGYWSFDGVDVNNYMNLAYDRSGQNNHGSFLETATSARFDIGIIGQGFHPDGIDDYVNIDDKASLRFGTGDFTISVWVKFPIGHGMDSWDGIISKGFGTTAPAHTWGIVRRQDLPNVINYYAATDAGGSAQISIQSGVISNGWHHIVGFRSGSTAKLYIDGIYNAQDTTASCDLSTTDPITIGTETSNRHINTTIDEVRLYNRALSENEIADLYRIGSSRMKANAQFQGDSNGMISNWTFDGKDINWSLGRAFDISGNNLFGTLMNMSTTSSCVIGKSGQAILLDGDDDWMEIADNNALDTLGDYTISMWVYNKAGSKSYPTLMNRAGQSAVNGFFWIYTTGTNETDLKFQYANGSDFITETFSSALGQNTWNHLLFSFVNSTKELKCYMDGKQFSTTRTLTNSLPVDDGKLYFGTYNNVSTDYRFFGYLDEIRLYGRALSADEVQTLHRQSQRRIKMKTD